MISALQSKWCHKSVCAVLAPTQTQTHDNTLELNNRSKNAKTDAENLKRRAAEVRLHEIHLLTIFPLADILDFLRVEGTRPCRPGCAPVPYFDFRLRAM
jgi:hypothetical protein